MILQVVSPRELLPKARAVGIQASPVEARNLVDRFFMSLAVIRCSKAFCASAIVETTTIHLLVLLLMLPAQR